MKVKHLIAGIKIEFKYTVDGVVKTTDVTSKGTYNKTT